MFLTPRTTSAWSTSPFIAVAKNDPNQLASSLRILIISDLQAVPQKIAQLSEWIAQNGFAFSIDLILVIGISRPHKRTDIRHDDLAELGYDSATIAELEQICSKVVYVPGLHEAGAMWESDSGISLTSSSLNAVAGPVHITDDLIVVHRRYADGITEKPHIQLPDTWKKTLYAKMSRPLRYREPKKSSAIVLCSSQLPTQGSSSKSRAVLRTVKSFLSIPLSTMPKPTYDYILAVAPPKMQRIPTSSNVLRAAEQTIDSGSFAEGEFWIVNLRRPKVWDPLQEPEIDDDQLQYESAWEVESTFRYNDSKPQQPRAGNSFRYK